MSWSINKRGTVAEARAHVEAEKCFEQYHGPANTPNEAQFENAKACILIELTAVPADRVVNLEASGHSDANYSRVSILVEAQKPAPVAAAGVGEAAVA